MAHERDRSERSQADKVARGGAARVGFLPMPIVFLVLLFVGIWFLAGNHPDDALPGHQPRASVTQRGSGVRSLAFSPDGRHLASIARIEGLAIWDLPTMKRRALSRPDLQSLALAFDGRRLAVASTNDKTIAVIDALTGSDQTTLAYEPETQQGIIGLAFGPGETLIGGCSEGRIWVWDLESDRIALDIRPQGIFCSIAVSPDGKVAAVGSNQGWISVWNVVNGRRLAEWASTTSRSIFALAILPDGQRLVAGEDQVLRVWDLAKGRPLAEMLGHKAGIEVVAVSPDGRTIASGDRLGQLRLWDAASGDPLASIEGHTLQVGALAFSADGQTLASGGSDSKIQLWNVAELLGSSSAGIPHVRGTQEVEKTNSQTALRHPAR